MYGLTVIVCGICPQQTWVNVRPLTAIKFIIYVDGGGGGGAQLVIPSFNTTGFVHHLFNYNLDNLVIPSLNSTGFAHHHS